MNKLMVTGSSGLVGSKCVEKFCTKFNKILGIDNNSRGKWFGENGSVSTTTDYLKSNFSNFDHLDCNVTDYSLISRLILENQPNVIIHCAGQPSHEKSSVIPYEDFLVNTGGTVNILESIRKYSPETIFIFLSTSKVYGDSVNLIDLKEEDLRYSLVDGFKGINESFSIDQTLHSPFGVNKAAADLIAQEYGNYYGLKTVCFRCGCITGKNHKGVEQHGFLSYLCKSFMEEKTYKVFGYNGKQVRDNIDASDLVDAFSCVIDDFNPCRTVYNMGGGSNNSCSILESFNILKDMKNKNFNLSFEEGRKGDHICYITDFSKFQKDYPQWKIQKNLHQIFLEMILDYES